MDEKTKKKIETKLRSAEGLAIVWLKNTNDPKEGSLRLEGDADDADDAEDAEDLVLKTSRSGLPGADFIPYRARCKDVVGVFDSTEASDAIVLMSAALQVGNRFLHLDLWRFKIVDVDTRADFTLFLRSRGAFANGLLTNVIPTEGMRMVGASLSIEFSDPGIKGLPSSSTSELLRFCEDVVAVGGKVAFVAPFFTLFATVISNYELRQGLKLDFINAMVRWSEVAPHLEGEDKVGLQLLKLVEEFFFKPGWRRHFASKDFQGSLERLVREMEKAILKNTYFLVKHISDTLDDRRVTSPPAGGFQELLRTLAQARENSDLDGVLDVASFVSPDNIPLLLLGEKDMVDQLCDLKLLRKDRDEHYSMDAVTQKVARMDRSPRNAFRTLNKILELCVKRNDPRRKAAAEAVLPHVKWLRESVHITGALFREDRKHYARLLKTSGHVYRKVLPDLILSRYLYNDALTLYRAVYENQKHVTIAKALYDLGCANELLGDYHEAKKHYQEALSIYRDISRGQANNSAIASTLCCLGIVYESLREYETAKEHYREALTMYRSLYGEDANHAEIATMLRNLGNVCKPLSEYVNANDAKEHYEEALEMYRALEGEEANRMEIARTLDSLANVYNAQEDYATARNHFQQALAMFRTVLGEEANHSEIAKTLYHLGNVCESLEDYAQAEQHITEALAMYRAVPGSEAILPTVIRSLGRLYESRGDYERAQQHFEEAGLSR